MEDTVLALQITHTHTHMDACMHTHTPHFLDQLAAHVADLLQQCLQGLQGTVAVVVTPGTGCTLARSCSNTSVRIERGTTVTPGTRVTACRGERLTWWSVWRSAAQRLTALCIEPRSVVLVKVDVREVQHLAHLRARLQRMGST